MPHSVLDAIKTGHWNFEPDFEADPDGFSPTTALPGSSEKVRVLTQRVASGLPLWHPQDRRTVDDRTDC